MPENVAFTEGSKVEDFNPRQLFDAVMKLDGIVQKGNPDKDAFAIALTEVTNQLIKGSPLDSQENRQIIKDFKSKKGALESSALVISRFSEEFKAVEEVVKFRPGTRRVRLHLPLKDEVFVNVWVAPGLDFKPQIKLINFEADDNERFPEINARSRMLWQYLGLISA